MFTKIWVRLQLETRNIFFFLLEMYEMYAGVYDKKIPIILSKLIYKDKSWLKELWKISRCFRSHIVSLHESSQSITGNSPQTTRWSSYWCWVLLKVLPWLSKWKPKGEYWAYKLQTSHTTQFEKTLKGHVNPKNIHFLFI